MKKATIKPNKSKGGYTVKISGKKAVRRLTKSGAEKIARAMERAAAKKAKK